MSVNRSVQVSIALVLGAAAVAVAAVAGAGAAGARPGARAVTVAAAGQGNIRAVPPMLPPLRPSELAAVRRAEAQQWQALSYRLPAGARYSTAEMNVFAAEGYARP
jgi:hypothetical protein